MSHSGYIPTVQTSGPAFIYDEGLRLANPTPEMGSRMTIDKIILKLAAGLRKQDPQAQFMGIIGISTAGEPVIMVFNIKTKYSGFATLRMPWQAFSATSQQCSDALAQAHAVAATGRVI